MISKLNSSKQKELLFPVVNLLRISAAYHRTLAKNQIQMLLLSLACEDVKEGLTKVMLRTVDTDVLVIAISVAKKININKKHFGF